MTPEQQRLSRLLAEHPECWEWWAGMSSGGWRLVRQSAISGWVAYRDDGSFSAILSPEDVDLSDPATAACLAAQAMGLGAGFEGVVTGWWWDVLPHQSKDWKGGKCGQADSLGEAAARALLALGGVSDG